MNRIITSFIVFLVSAVALSSQSASQALQVIYITKDYTTEVNPLCSELRDIFEFAEKDNSQAVIFYLANSSAPLIVKVNLPDDNRKDFDMIIDALMTKSETIINPSVDLTTLVGLFDEVELLDNGGEKNFSNVELIYYITPTFWELGYNEQIIASAYFALDMDSKWADGYMSMSIYHNAQDGLEVDSEHPFGEKNLCHNYKFFLLTYSNE